MRTDPSPRGLALQGLGAFYRSAARPVLFRSGGGDPETAHHRTLSMVAALGHPAAAPARVAGRAMLRVADPVELMGLRFANRVGLAAGMDKDGAAIAGWAALGFGHVEVGTVTAHAQPGNPRPRLYRLPRSRAIINRMGFNNLGADALAARLQQMRAGADHAMVVGASIGKSKVTPVEEAEGDYLTSVDALTGHCDYLAVNVSSPNTPGLRGLQDAEPLQRLLAAIVTRSAERAGERAGTPAPPVLVKLAPDLDEEAIAEAVEVATAAGVAGIIATNTTLERRGVDVRELALAEQAGGLSGAPLTTRARAVVRQVRGLTELPIIGVGGVLTSADARALRDVGADLVQLYSGLVYTGPSLIPQVARC